MNKWVPDNCDFFFFDNLKVRPILLFFVRDTLNYDGDWNMNLTYNNLSINVVNEVLSLLVSSDTGEAGNLGRGGSNTCKFAIQSACRLQTRNIQTLENTLEGG